MPSLIVSADSYHLIETCTAIVVPIFPSNQFGNPMLIAIDGNGLELSGNPHAACDLLRAIGATRLLKKHGKVSHATIEQVEVAIGRLLSIKTKPRSGGWGA